MTDTERIRQLERHLADLNSVSTADIQRKIDLLNDLAWMLSDTDLKRAYALSETAHSLAISPDDGEPPYQIGLAYSLRTQGYLNQRFGDYPLGLTQLLKAQEISELLALDDSLADIFDGIAGIYYQVGNYPEALNYIYKQLDAAQRIGDKRRMTNAYNNLANIYFETGDYERAVETLNHNLQIAAETNYKRIEFLSYINLTETYLLAGDYEKALENALRGLPVSQEAGFELFEVYAFDFIGKSYQKLGDAGQAIHHFEKALALSRKVESEVTESLILLNIGQAYHGMKQPDLALDYLQRGIIVAQSIDAKSELFKGHLQLSEIYEQQGDFAQALYHFKKHQSFKELVHGEKADERLQILQVGQDTENAKKEAEIFQLRTVQLEQEITERKEAETALRETRDKLEQQVELRTVELSNTVVLLQQEIEERERAETEIQQMVELLEQRVADRTQELTEINQELQIAREEAEETAILEERRRLARDLHDAITQSLYGLMLFARASRDAHEANDDPKLEENLEEIETNALQTLKEMRLLLHQLRPLSLEHGGLSKAVIRRFDQVERRLGITAVADVEDNIDLDRTTEESLYLIITEALNNSLKHAKARKVTVGLHQQNGNIRLVVEDNGLGFNPSKPTVGMGLKNIQERADLLDGELEFSSEKGKGTRIRLVIPESEVEG